MRTTGVTARGILTPIFRQGDDLVQMVADAVEQASQAEGFGLADGDIIGITEAVVGRTQGNYATCQQIAKDLQVHFGGEELGVVFPILSRNRFSILLKAMAMATKQLTLLLSYPTDEVGNALFDPELLEEKEVNPHNRHFDEAAFRETFGTATVHPFTGVDYIEFYKSFGENIRVVFSNDPRYILGFTKQVLVCDVHTRKRTQRQIQKASPDAKVLTLADILSHSVDGSGWSEYGLLGSNKATEDSVKLFPRDTQAVVDQVQAEMKKRTGRRIEVLVYGDGGFKDPKGGIWELADPVISPAHTEGLSGTPNELKIKYIADNELKDLAGEELNAAIRARITQKDGSLKGDMSAEGTTPRQITDLVGSLCDLVSGSGDRGTPVVLIQNYFTNYASED